MADMASRIKCFSCSKNLMPLRFSAVTQQRYRESLSRNQRDKRHEVFKPKCMNCTPGNVQEMKCHHCEKTMPLDRFAKAQRKTPDTALCKDCQQDRVDREADFAKEVEENNIIEREKKQMKSGTSQYSQSAAGSTLNSRFSELSVDPDERYETETNPGSDWAYGNTGVQVSSRGGSDSASVVSRSRTGTEWDNSTARSVITETSGKNLFVKQRAVPRTAQEKARDQYLREQQREQESLDVELDKSDSDSDDDDDEAPY